METTQLNPFYRSLVSSFVATVIDFSLTILLKELSGLWYLLSSSIGSVTGGVVNFLINRYWTFQATREPPIKQGFRYLIIWTGNILLNIGGVWFLTSICLFDYKLSKVFTSLIIGIFYNFFLQKNYVFKRSNIT